MNWYFNNQGVAEGPYDEPTMMNLAGGGRVGADTLVWQPTMNAWQEAAAVNASWWRPATRPQSIVVTSSPTTRSLTGPLPSDVRRTPVPNAPTEVLPSQEQRPGFFKKLFGGGGRKK